MKVYFLRAHKIIPLEPLVNLCLGIAYLHRAMQRQTDNRHHQVAQVGIYQIGCGASVGNMLTV